MNGFDRHETVVRKNQQLDKSADRFSVVRTIEVGGKVPLGDRPLRTLNIVLPFLADKVPSQPRDFAIMHRIGKPNRYGVK